MMRGFKSGSLHVFNITFGCCPAIVSFPDGRPNRLPTGDVIAGRPNGFGCRAQGFGNGGLYPGVRVSLDFVNSRFADTERMGDTRKVAVHFL